MKWLSNTNFRHFKLDDTVTHNQGSYAAIIADTISRCRRVNQSFTTWTPYWVSGVLVPNEDVVWLKFHSVLPGERANVDTTLSNGKNYGLK